MDTSVIGLIAIAAIGVVLLVAATARLMLTKSHQGHQGRHRDSASATAEDARRETLTVSDQDALADQTFATARRAAQADADAAHAVRLVRQVGGPASRRPSPATTTSTDTATSPM